MKLRDTVRNYILKEIERLKYADIKKLPTEEQMCKNFGVSRVTLRSALADLDREGKIIRVQGRGTFVNSHIQNMHMDLFRMDSYSRLIERDGYKLRVHALECKVVETPSFIKKIDSNAPSQLIMVSKAFFANERLAVICMDYITMDFIEDINILLKYEDSIFKYLFDKYNIQLVSGNISFNAVSNEEINEYLDVYKLRYNKDSILLIEGTDCDSNAKIIMYTREFIDTDIIKFSAIRRRAIEYS